MKWNVYNATGEWIGTARGGDAEEALKNAQAENQDAQRVEEDGGDEIREHVKP